MNAQVLDRKVRADGYKHVDIIVDGTVFSAGVSNPTGHYPERITTAENIVKACSAYAALRAQRDELIEALEKTNEMTKVLFSKIPYGDSPYASGYPEMCMGKNYELITKSKEGTK